MREILYSCPRCGYTMPEELWEREAVYDYTGRHIQHPIGGDHARCPECHKLLHIDYDLESSSDNGTKN